MSAMFCLLCSPLLLIQSMQIFVNSLHFPTYCIEAHSAMTVGEAMSEFARHKAVNMGIIQFSFQGIALEDDDELFADIGIAAESQLRCDIITR